MANPFTRLGQAYRQGVSSFITPAIRGIDAGAMAPTQRGRLLYSEASPQGTVEQLRTEGGASRHYDLLKEAEVQVRKNKANVGKSRDELMPEINSVARQLENNRATSTPREMTAGIVDNDDENLMLRALLSDPNDKQMTALLSDQQFAKAVGTTSQELLQTRQQLNDAATLASRVQREGPAGRGKELNIQQNDSLNALNLLETARLEPTNANLNRALDSIRSPMVTRTADPSAWEPSADIDVPWSKEADERTLERYYKNPITGEKLDRRYVTDAETGAVVDRGERIEPPSEGRLKTEDLSSFLNRAYGTTSSTQDALPGMVNTDFSSVVDLGGDTVAARAWQEANQLRAAAEAAEAIGFTASERAGAMTTAQKLKRLQQLESTGGNKLSGKTPGHDKEVQKAAKQLLELEGRPLSDVERTRIADEINANRPGVIDDALEQLARMPATADLDGSKITAQVLRSADRAGIKLDPRQPSDSRQFKTEQARHLHDFLTSPKLGVSAVSLGALTAAGALAAGINDMSDYQYDYTKKDSGEPFSNSVRDEALYRMRMADPAVIAEAIKKAEGY